MDRALDVSFERLERSLFDVVRFFAERVSVVSRRVVRDEPRSYPKRYEGLFIGTARTRHNQ